MEINRFLYSCSSIFFQFTQMLINLLKTRWHNLLQKEAENRVYVLHHSKNFLVVNKPYDMLINSNNPDRKYTLQSELRRMLPGLTNPKLCHEFHFVHRLDYVTSGIICIALNKRAARAASTAFETRSAKKFYLALVYGHVNEPYIVINKPIGCDKREKDGNHKMCTSDSAFCEKPKSSHTVLKVLEHGFRNELPATKVLLCPETGRRHQLRVHCSSIGHTIIGDYTYSNKKDTEPYRTFLHSFRLILNNHIENLDITSADPFTCSDPKNGWRVFNVIRTLDDAIFSSI